MIADKPINGLYFAKIDGNKVVRMGEVNEISVETKYPSADEMPDMSLNVSGQTFSATIELDRPLPTVEIARIMGLPVVVVSKLFSCVSYRLVPRKTHKKKRIRKKWIKRYGLKLLFSEEEEEPFIGYGTEGYTLFIGPDTWEKVREGYPDADIKPFLLLDYFRAKEGRR